MQRKFVQTVQVPGTLTADHLAYFTPPSNCQLVHVSAYCKTQDATLKIGTVADDDAYLESSSVAAGTTPTELARTDFVDDQYPNIVDGTTVLVTVGHGSNCVDAYIVLTFLEG